MTYFVYRLCVCVHVSSLKFYKRRLFSLNLFLVYVTFSIIHSLVSFVHFFCAKKNCLQDFQEVETFHDTEQYFNTTYEFCFNKCIHFLFWIVQNVLCTGNDKHRAHSRSHSHTIIKCHHKAYYLLQKMNKNSAFK